MKHTTIIIPYHNEGQQFIQDTVDSIKSTVDVDCDILIVDDCSRQKLNPIEGVKVIRQQENLGVGAAFDVGAKNAHTENLFLMGSDIRFRDNQWASKMIEEIGKAPKSLICSTCMGINKSNMNVYRDKISRRNGATILIFHDQKSHPKKAANFRNIIEAQWARVNKTQNGNEAYEIPCILGAFYGVKKSWYEYIDGFALHRSWGTLEPYISLKSWFMGGRCLTAPKVETAHIFKTAGVHGTPNYHLIYNKALVATLLFNDEDAKRLIDFLGTNPQVEQGKEMIVTRREEIRCKRDEYRKKFVLDADTYCKKWEIDFRK